VLDELGVVAIFGLKVHGVSKEPVEEVERAETNHPLWKDHLGLSVKLDGQGGISSRQLKLVMDVSFHGHEVMWESSNDETEKSAFQEALGPSEHKALLFSNELSHVLSQVEGLWMLVVGQTLGGPGVDGLEIVVSSWWGVVHLGFFEVVDCPVSWIWLRVLADFLRLNVRVEVEPSHFNNYKLHGVLGFWGAIIKVF